MIQMMIGALTLIVATGFSWSMQTLRRESEDFYQTRLQLLADPRRAAAIHCGRSEDQRMCARSIEIRREGTWEDVCRHQDGRTFQVERFYRVTFTCRTVMPNRTLPALVTILKR